jgi:hypothetical protein
MLEDGESAEPDRASSNFGLSALPTLFRPVTTSSPYCRENFKWLAPKVLPVEKLERSMQREQEKIVVTISVP